MRLLFVFMFLFSFSAAYSQVGYGFTMTNDIYHRYANPKDGLAYPASGSAILNIGGGPKVWFGGRNLSLSLEGQAVIGFLGLAVKDYKGLGTVSYPLMAKLNFNGLSALDKEGRMGWSVGGGIQYSKTELYGLDDDFEAKGVKRKLFKTYFAQMGYGFGISGFGVQGFARYGWNGDSKANTMAIGLQWDFNMRMLKKITSPESSL
ncbi:MAG: hypothetical protein IPN29_08365 [Saprospiraceae bacterium]|nr:hypothetical protein [Saprospiraceae bacterium]